MEHRFYLGIDLDDQYAVISSYELNKKEPETFSAIAGSEIYQIPALRRFLWMGRPIRRRNC